MRVKTFSSLLVSSVPSCPSWKWLPKEKVKSCTVIRSEVTEGQQYKGRRTIARTAGRAEIVKVCLRE